MSGHRDALGAALLGAVLATAGALPAATVSASPLSAAAAATSPAVEFVGKLVWRMDDPDFGGFSGLEISADGRSYWALSDRGTLRWGSVERDSQGRIRALTMAGNARLKDQKGRPLSADWMGDSEGLAVDPAGPIYVSFESVNRIMRYEDPDAAGVRLTDAPWFRQLKPNAGMEALAIDAQGDLVTLPEEPIANRAQAEVMRLHGTEWTEDFAITRDPEWKPTGADIGPDGQLYVLERAFHGFRGFSSRVRRFDMAAARAAHATGSAQPVAGEVLLETAPRQYDNLEGLAVWRDDLGIRLTMISDDNFFWLQQTQLVEYRVRD